MPASLGLKAVKGASEANSDERCDPAAAALATAKYYKLITAKDFGSAANSISYPLAIAAKNSGETATEQNFKTASEAKKDEKVSFWTLLEMKDKLGAQFQTENSKYVPKFFAAWIVGKNPRAFGVDASPLSAN